MRKQWCREHIDDIAENCGLHPASTKKPKQAGEFCKVHRQFCDCSTDAIMTLIYVSDDSIRDAAIQIAEKRLNQKTPTGGKVKKSLTAQEIKTIIDKVAAEAQPKDPEPKIPVKKSKSFDHGPASDHTQQTKADRIQALESEKKECQDAIIRHKARIKQITKEIKMLQSSSQTTLPETNQSSATA